MEKSEFRKNAYDMIYLTACAVNGKVPKKERVEKIDKEKLFEVSETHILTAAVAYALESAGVKEDNFTQAKEKSVRKNIIMDMERSKILARLEKEKIWYMPLKGSIIKDWYPKLGMRQMSDNDILCADERRKDVKYLMEDLGFVCQHYEVGNDDTYYKEPVCNFEMHNELFRVNHDEKLYNYYKNIKEKLVKDSGNEYGYHFRNEDFYLYMMSHDYKHYMRGGIGVRSLFDIYIFMKRFGKSLDFEYISEEAKKLGAYDFEKNSRELAIKICTFSPLTLEDKKALDYYIFSGAYGTVLNWIKSGINRESSKKAYVLHRIFPPMKQIKVTDPFFYRHKYLIPFLWVWRFFRAMTVSRKTVMGEIKELTK